jgi:inosose dehydratase
MLDEMVAAGYRGTELGPHGFLPVDAEELRNELSVRKLELLGSFVPVRMGQEGAEAAALQRIKQVGGLLSALHAPFLVLADDQSDQRNKFSGRADDPSCPKLTADQWRHVGRIVAEAEKVSSDFGLDLVFHPHVATYVETPEECAQFFDATSHTNIGLCLDTGHCLYGKGDPVLEAQKYRNKLRFIHLKDCDSRVLETARARMWTFEEAIEHKVFTILGKGAVDFPEFFQTLIRIGYAGWAVVEQDVKFGDPSISPARIVTESRAYLQSIVEDLDAVAFS